MFYLIVYRLKKAIRFLSEPFFFLVYSFIQALIFIGDATRRIVLLPYTAVMAAYRITHRYLTGVRPRLKAKKLTTPSFKIDLLKVRSLLRVNYTSVEHIVQSSKKGYDRDRKWLLKKFSLIGQSIAKNIVARCLSSVSAFTKSALLAVKKFLSSLSSFTRTLQAALQTSSSASLKRLQSSGKGIGKASGALTTVTAKRVSSTITATGNGVSALFSAVGSTWNSIVRFFVSHKLRYFIAGLATCFIVVFIWQSYAFVKTLPSPENIGKLNYPTSTHMYDRNGKLLYEIYREQNRTPIAMKDLPENLRYATIATEDREFYSHKGISLINGMLRAVRDTYKTKELQGGSTITQQLVKSALLSPERTVERKVKEIILAVWTERLYSKDQILEMYLNQVPYGGSAYGVEEASRQYFGKSAKKLTLEEAAFLAGLPQAPSLYSPYLNPDRASFRRNEVLRLMLQEKYITKKQYDEAVKKPLTVKPPTIDIKAPHFVFYAKQALEQKYGATVVEEGGLRVKTTIDLDIQQEAEKILKEEIAKVSYANINNGAILVTQPSTGQILAMVGSVDYYASPSGAFNVTTALRQPGSSIKPVMYSLALENGFTAASIIEDQPLVIQIPGAEAYNPVNYDGRYHGRVPLRMALANSYNIPAVKVLQSLGVQRFLYHAEKMGIDTWQDKSRFGLSVTLGGGEVRMTDMAEAFGVFASKGNLLNLNSIQDIETLHGDKLEYDIPQPRQVLDSGIAYIISDILSDNVARQAAFGPGSQLEIPNHKVAVKTGTTNELKDNWTIGYTPDYVVTVWVGNNDSTPMNQYLVSGITGAAPIWHRVMEYLVTKDKSDRPGEWYEQPTDIVSKPCYAGKTEYFLAGTENSAFCAPQQNRFNNFNNTPSGFVPNQGNQNFRQLGR